MKDIEKQLDILRSKKVKEIWFCEYCWNTNKLEAHHIFTRKNKPTRRDLSNWKCLCLFCHTQSSDFSAHITPWKFKERLKETKWEERLDALKLKSYSIKNFKTRELEELLETFI